MLQNLSSNVKKEKPVKLELLIHSIML